MMSGAEFAGYAAGGIIVSALSQMRTPVMTSSPTGFSEYIPSSSVASSPLYKRRKVSFRRRRRRYDSFVNPYVAQKFVKKPTFYKLPK